MTPCYKLLKIMDLVRITLDARPKTRFCNTSASISFNTLPIPQKGDCMDFSKHDCKVLFGIQSYDDTLFTTVSNRTYSIDGKMTVHLLLTVDNE